MDLRLVSHVREQTAGVHQPAGNSPEEAPEFILLPPSTSWPLHTGAAHSLGVCALREQFEVLTHLSKEIMELLQIWRDLN